MMYRLFNRDESFNYNLLEITTESTKIIIDCGRDLPPNDSNELNNRVMVEGLTYGDSIYDSVIVVNHHADHNGFIQYINTDIPIYMHIDTKRVLDIIADFCDAPIPRVDNYIYHGNEMQVGDIKILLLTTDFRVAGAILLLIKTEEFNLLYTNGYKHIDPAYTALLDKVNILFCEDINFNKPGQIATFTDVEEELSQIMRETDGHVFVLTSPTNALCVRSVEKACRDSGRSIAIDPFLMAIQEQVTNPLFVSPVGFMPYKEKDITPRILKNITTNNIFYYDIPDFADIEVTAEMKKLTYVVRHTLGDFIKQFYDLKLLSGAVLICFIWHGYYEESEVCDFIELCRSFNMRVEFIKIGDYAYKKQIMSLINQFEPKIYETIQRNIFLLKTIVRTENYVCE